jgi:hypothetical protein
MRNNTYICEKHKKTSRRYGKCPICREVMKSIGDKKRIGHCGQFDKIERKTRKLDGKRPIVSFGLRSRRHKEYIAYLKKHELGPFYRKKI